MNCQDPIFVIFYPLAIISYVDTQEDMGSMKKSYWCRARNDIFSRIPIYFSIAPFSVYIMNLSCRWSFNKDISMFFNSKICKHSESISLHYRSVLYDIIMFKFHVWARWKGWEKQYSVSKSHGMGILEITAYIWFVLANQISRFL